MDLFNADNFSDLLAKRRPDAPQVIIAGWYARTGQLVGGSLVACDSTPTEGETLLAHAAALAACIQRINELFASEPKMLDAAWGIVERTVDDLKKRLWIKNDLAAPAALPGAADAPAEAKEPETIDRAELMPLAEDLERHAAEMDRRFRFYELGLSSIIAERERQVDVEKMSPGQDDTYINGELIAAAVAYAQVSDPSGAGECAADVFPFRDVWWKPSENPIRNLEKSGALIAAEIARLRRSEQQGPFWIVCEWPNGAASKESYSDLSEAQDALRALAAPPEYDFDESEDNVDVPPSVVRARIVGRYGSEFGASFSNPSRKASPMSVIPGHLSPNAPTAPPPTNRVRVMQTLQRLEQAEKLARDAAAELGQVPLFSLEHSVVCEIERSFSGARDVIIGRLHEVRTKLT